MDFGIFAPPYHPPNRSIADSYDRDIDLIVEADRLGYQEAWIGEHITDVWENVPTPDLLIAKALALTDRIILGTGVTLLPIHHPVDTAHRIAMLDHMARGRFHWGIGVRTTPSDLQLYGVAHNDMQAVREQGHEALEVILGLWAAEDGHFEYEGKYYQVHAPELSRELERGLYFKPYQKPHPPIGVASNTPGSHTIRMAGERGWIPMSSPYRVRDLRTHWELIEEGAASTGRKADRRQWHIVRDVYVGETPESAREGARVVLGRPFNEHQWVVRKALGVLSGVKSDPSMPDEAVNVDYMMENVWIVGDPQECADKINELFDGVGGFGTLLAIVHDPDDPSLMHRSLRLLKEEVGPRVRDLG